MARAAKALPLPERREPLAGERIANRRVTVEALPPAARLSLRCDEAGAKALGKSLGLTLPARVGTTGEGRDRMAVKVGPDEYLVIDPKPDAKLMPKAKTAGVSAIDVSHRNVAFSVAGPGAADTLNAACPRDLRDAAFPVGAGARTIFGRAEIILIRTGEDEYRVECWRSFAPYVFGMLRAGARDAAHG